MALLGLSLLVASVVYVILRPPPWFSLWRAFTGAIADGSSKQPDEGRKPPDTTITSQDAAAPRIQQGVVADGRDATTSVTTAAATQTETCASTKQAGDREAMPPPPLPTTQPPTIEEPDSPTTPKASATLSTQPVPSFSLSSSSSSSSSGAPGLMMPPPPPPFRPSSGRIPALNQFPAPNSAQRARGPTPNRGPPSSSSSSSLGLAPPPTHSSVPSKPSRKVMLTPGHSPLDWARISGPNADLRGLSPSSPFLRVTPSMLKAQTGRKGKDAWMALSGKVYNVTPYAQFHPGGVPELMRGAARDATKLFGEVHPWVNCETMLSACFVGLLVDEPQAGQESDMDKMD